MKFTQWIFSILIPLSLSACGQNGSSSSLTAPDAPVSVGPAIVTFVSWLDGKPLAGVPVMAGNVSVGVTDGGGAVIIDKAFIGKSMSFTAPHHVERVFVLTEGPSIQRVFEDNAVTSLLQYLELTFGVNQGGEKHLERPTERVLTWQPSADIWSDSRIPGALHAAIKKVNAFTAISSTNGAQFELDESASLSVPFAIKLTLDPGDPDNPGELTYAYTDGRGVITSCEVKLESTKGFFDIHLQRVLQHASMHCLGIVHAPGFEGIMGDQGVPSLEFTLSEKRIFRHHLFQKPDVRKDDIDPDVPVGAGEDHAVMGMRERDAEGGILVCRMSVADLR